MIEERRVVTVLFSDVAGSTAIASQMDPEDWAEIMAGLFNYLIQPVERYGGNVARLMGDAILAFFGAPIAHEDDRYMAAARIEIDYLARQLDNDEWRKSFLNRPDLREIIQRASSE